jgi:GNAT superfamily N-acetyltransferase
MLSTPSIRTQAGHATLEFDFDAKLIDAFLRLPHEVYRADPAWIAPIRASVRKQLSPGNPWFSRGKARHFIVPGKARASAFLLDGETQGHVGFFESTEDYDAAAGVLDAAVSWLRERGATAVRGPVNFDTWHSYRFITSGWESGPPFLLEPYNPPYYPQIWERFGFRCAAKYFSNLQPDLAAVTAQLRRHHEKAVKAGVTFRPISLETFEADLRVLYEMSCAIFRENFGYRPIAFGEFADLYAGSKRLLDVRLTTIATDKDGKAIGFAFGLPDHGAAVRAMRGDGGVFGKLRFLAAARQKADMALLKTIGVVPEARGTNVGFAVCYEHYRNALDAGYKAGVHALMIADNTSRRMSENKGGKPWREYAVYDLA